MNGNAPIDIAFSGADEAEIDRAVEMLRQQPGVTGIRQEEAGLLRVELDGDEALAAGLLKRLIADDFAVADFHRIPMNLEKVFMEVTQE